MKERAFSARPYLIGICLLFRSASIIGIISPTTDGETFYNLSITISFQESIQRHFRTVRRFMISSVISETTIYWGSTIYNLVFK